MWGHYMQEQLLTAAHKQGTATFPATAYVGLSSTLGNPDGTGWTEPTIATNGYGRLSLDQATRLAIDTSAQPFVENANIESFAESSGAWLAGVSLPYFHVWDAASAGNFLWGGTLATPRQVDASGITLTVAAGELTSRADTA